MTPKAELAYQDDDLRRDKETDKLGSRSLGENRADSEDISPAIIDLGKLGIRPLASRVEDPGDQLALIGRDGTPIDHADEVVAATPPPDGYDSWREYALRDLSSDQQKIA